MVYWTWASAPTDQTKRGKFQDVSLQLCAVLWSTAHTCEEINGPWNRQHTNLNKRRQQPHLIQIQSAVSWSKIVYVCWPSNQPYTVGTECYHAYTSHLHFYSIPPTQNLFHSSFRTMFHIRKSTRAPCGFYKLAWVRIRVNWFRQPSQTYKATVDRLSVSSVIPGLVSFLVRPHIFSMCAMALLLVQQS